VVFHNKPEFWSHNAFSPGTQTQSQAPIGAFEGHLSYDVKRRLGSHSTAISGRRPDQLEWDRRRGYSSEKLPHRRNSLNPLTKHQSLKFSYSNGDYVRFGGNFQNLSVRGSIRGWADPIRLLPDCHASIRLGAASLRVSYERASQLGTCAFALASFVAWSRSRYLISRTSLPFHRR